MQVVLSLADNADAVGLQVEKVVADFAARGFRSIGVARTFDQGKWQLPGRAAPLRPASR